MKHVPIDDVTTAHPDTVEPIKQEPRELSEREVLSVAGGPIIENDVLGP